MSGQTEILSIMRLLKPQRSAFRKIRVGSLGDGGYVLPDDLAGISDVLSIGIGDEVSFDLHFAQQGIPVYQYDPTVQGPPIPHEHFHFHPIAWSQEDGAATRSLSSMLQLHGLQRGNDAILKFDTEGAEWQSLRSTPADVLKHFRIIVCELHGFNSMTNPAFMQDVRQVMNLLSRNHTLVHLHANNCCGISLLEGVPVPAVLELTLLRNDRSDFSPCSEPIPGPLDYPNMTDRPDLVLGMFA